MKSILRLAPRPGTPVSSLSTRRSVTNTHRPRTYVHDTFQNFAQANEHDPQQECDLDNTPNHPIPSNKAHPTLRDGRQSNLSDIEGQRHEGLPEDVKKHNEEMEHRYDRPYNHIADEGKIEKVFKQQ
ncbi:hypothetical protein N7492_001562 [Penicillium capsulatum]|uniref:Uncharacterized protein n=1 Tax=Penicillium capsulatum TaxID=69766 RepID=A0A9W9IXZ5_9EURO|nr:hypothetical protein N7492_001562 [Penicillium capsulatum]KAJ6129386.1 hypothetical protein N7512_002166 [Penicillium capsulatum]